MLTDKQKHIICLLADGEFHSGTELAQALAVSRSAIWKQLASLNVLGLAYTAVSGKGYRLESPLELLSAEAIQQVLTNEAKALLGGLQIFEQIDSTNRYLSEQAQHQAVSGLFCLAEQQTAGKGRRGRQWVSPFGCNIYLSLLWRFQHGYAGAAGLSLAVGVAVIDALRELGIDGLGLKWPNDIYYQGKKLGGILIEMSGEADGPCHAVIGLGLNLYLPDSQAEGINQAWTDLSKVLGQRFSKRNLLVGYLIKHLLMLMADFETVGLPKYLPQWRHYDCLLGQAAQVFVGEQVFTGVVQGVDANGLLLFQHTDGKIQAFASGEVSFHGHAS